jgi:hypothetical protein
MCNVLDQAIFAKKYKDTCIKYALNKELFFFLQGNFYNLFQSI